MRANYIRSFYIPEYHPLPSPYSSHFKSRVPPHCSSESFCNYGRKKADDECCLNCIQSLQVVKCALEKEISKEVLDILKPFARGKCDSQYPDKQSLESHVASHLSRVDSVTIHPGNMNLAQLRETLRARNLSTTGNKSVLVRRLEGALSGEC